jgi:hypothetical protein
VTKFLFVYYGGMMAATPAAQKKSMEAWMGWFKGMGKGLADMGASTKPGGMMVGKGGAKAIAMGDMVTGYSVVMTDNMDAAVKMAKGSPSMPDGGSVAVYELMPM